MFQNGERSGSPQHDPLTDRSRQRSSVSGWLDPTTANDMIFGALNPAEAGMLQHLIRVLVRDGEKALHVLEGPEWRETAIKQN